MAPRAPQLALLVRTALLLCAALACARNALADPAIDGKWKQGALSETYTVQQWLPGCGPAPQSGTAGGGDVVAIHQDGDELSFVGAGRVYKSNQCYDQLPTLSREAHSRDPSGRSWLTRCTTPANDPRRAMMNTRVSITTDSHIDINETGRYEISLSEGRCIADVKRARSFDLIVLDNAPAPAATPTAAPPPAPTAVKTAAPAPACANPGEAARLEVRPSQKLVRVGDAFAFRAVVLDANGCATSTPIKWTIDSLVFKDGQAHAGQPDIDATGKLTVPTQDFGDATFNVVATAAGKSAHAEVQATSSAMYDAMLAKSGLNASGENDTAAVAVIATGAIGGDDAKAEDGARKRRTIFVALVSAVALVLGAVALVFWRRSKRVETIEHEMGERHAERVRLAEEEHAKRKREHDAQMRAYEESAARAKSIEDARRARAAAKAAEAAGPAQPASGTMLCPACRREYPPSTLHCPNDAARLVPLAGNENLLVGPSGSICPACKRGYPPGTKTCPNDGEELVPQAARPITAAAPSAPGQTGPRAKICPTCGDRFEGNATFCGKDGTALVLVN